MSIRSIWKYYRLKTRYERAARLYLKGSRLVERHEKTLQDAQRNAFLGLPLEYPYAVPQFVRHESGAFRLALPKEKEPNRIQKWVTKLQDEQQMRLVVGEYIPHLWHTTYNESHRPTFLTKLLDKYINVYKHVPIPPEYSDPFEETGVAYRAGITTVPEDIRDDITKANDAIKEEEDYAKEKRDWPVRKYTIRKLAAVTLNLQKDFDNAIEELKQDENMAVIRDALKRMDKQERIQAAMDAITLPTDDEEEDDGLSTAVRTALNASVMASINATALH